MTPNRKLTTASVLAYLAAAGPEGAVTTVIADAHDYPVTYQHRSNYTSTILARLDDQGYAERTGTERSPRYRGTPVSRWRITRTGRARFRADAKRAAARAELDARIERAAQARKDALAATRTAIATLVDSGGMAAVTPEWRAATVKELRAVPCTLAEIGELFGITKERVRQIEMFGTSPVR